MESIMTNCKGNERLAWVDTGKFICMFFVMLSHLELHTIGQYFFYSPFFLTGFFFLSGYVYKSAGTFAEHFRKKTYQLLLPWVILSNLNIILRYIISFNEQGAFLDELKWNFLQIRGYGDELWFVAALYVAYIPFYFFIKYLKPKSCFVVTALLYIASVIYGRFFPDVYGNIATNSLPWHLDYIPQAMLFMMLGYFFKELKFETIFRKVSNKKSTVVGVLVYLMLSLLIGKCVRNHIFPVGLELLVNSLLKLLAITTLIMVSQNVKTNKLISFVGRNTLCYFAFHGKVLSAMETGMKVLIPALYVWLTNNTWIAGLAAIAETFIICVVLIVPTMLTNKYFPFCVGKKSTRVKRNL